MSTRLSLLALVLAFGGCATFDQSELSGMRARGVPEPLVRKVERNRSLRPEEIATLSRRGVPPARLVRYLHRSGVNYLLTPEDAQRLRRSGVSSAVLDALVEEGADFARDYGTERRRSAGVTAGDPYFSSPDPYGFEW